MLPNFVAEGSSLFKHHGAKTHMLKIICAIKGFPRALLTVCHTSNIHMFVCHQNCFCKKREFSKCLL